MFKVCVWIGGAPHFGKLMAECGTLLSQLPVVSTSRQSHSSSASMPKDTARGYRCPTEILFRPARCENPVPCPRTARTEAMDGHATLREGGLSNNARLSKESRNTQQEAER